MSDELSEKIVFPLKKDEDGYPPLEYEYLSAQVQGDLYVIDNIPFFVRGVSLGDVVRAETTAERELWFKEVVRPSAHTTLRVIVFRESRDPRPIEERVAEVRRHLTNLGCDSELSHISGLFAVDVPPQASLDAILDYLRSGETEELWEYEEGALR